LLQRKRKGASEREIASFLGFFYRDLQCQTSPNREIESFRDIFGVGNEKRWCGSRDRQFERRQPGDNDAEVI